MTLQFLESPPEYRFRETNMKRANWLIGGIVVVAFAGFFIGPYLDYQRSLEKEVDASEIRKLVEIAERHPELKSLILDAMADGKMLRRESDGVYSKLSGVLDRDLERINKSIEETDKKQTDRILKEWKESPD